LALLYVGLGVLAIGMFAFPLWYAWETSVEYWRLELIREDVQRFTEVFDRVGAQGLTDFIDERVSLQIAGERTLLLTTPTLQPLAGNLDAWPKEVPAGAGVYTLRLADIGPNNELLLMHSVLPGGYNLLVGRDLSRYSNIETRFWFGLAFAVAVLLAVGLCGGFLVRRAVLSGIDHISRSTRAIVRGDLRHRLPVGTGESEFDSLSRTINRMFDQIEQLVHGVRNVSNAIAHDLRTPLAELRSRLEELAIARPSPEETFAEVGAAVEDVDRVIGIFNALLRLAEIDTGVRRSGFEPVNATALAADVAEFYRPAADLKGIALSYRSDSPDVTLSGDPVLLAQAVGNLIDNALKFTPLNGHVVIAVDHDDDGRPAISVSDDGPGIADQEKPLVTERFYRGDQSRNSTPGVGLGLSLVSAVALLHAGQLRLLDNHPGLKAQLILSLA
jgi:signal transduction histidine kinase